MEKVLTVNALRELIKDLNGNLPIYIYQPPNISRVPGDSMQSVTKAAYVPQCSINNAFVELSAGDSFDW